MTREKKVLSSRDESPDVLLERMGDFLFLLWDVLDKPIDIDPPETMEGLMAEVSDSLLDLATKYTEVVESNNRLASDVLSLTISNTALKTDLYQCTKMVAGLCGPVVQDVLLGQAVKMLAREGNATIVPHVKHGVSMTGYAFEAEEDLREGLKCAIEAYNNDLAGKILTS